MRVGDLGKNIATGDLAIVTGVGGGDRMLLSVWPVRARVLAVVVASGLCRRGARICELDPSKIRHE